MVHPLKLKSLALKWYARRDVAERIVREARSREVAVRFAQGFGKRPDMLETPEEVFHLARQGMLSVHVSEELWDDPLRIPEAERIGWDFILDIDAPVFEEARLITDAFVKLLQEAYGVRSIAVKFSGNKGFHIAIPWEALPERVVWKGRVMETRLLFPDLPRALAETLLAGLQRSRLIRADTRSRRIFFPGGSVPLQRETPLTRVCHACGREQPEVDVVLECRVCQHVFRAHPGEEPVACPSCHTPGPFRVVRGGDAKQCAYCKAEAVSVMPRMRDLVKLDTLLISSRHLFRSVYSLHEKSGLISIPVPLDGIVSFNREAARPERVERLPSWLEDVRVRASRAEMERLVEEAVRMHAQPEEEKPRRSPVVVEGGFVGEAFFPPCIRALAQGVEDGRKRGVFILINFLRSLGWSDEQIREYVYAWNERNAEPLRETLIKTQLRYHLSRDPVLPPNCSHPDYYKDIGICQPDELCARIKNPVQYARLKARLAEKGSRRRAQRSARKEKEGREEEQGGAGKGEEKE